MKKILFFIAMVALIASFASAQMNVSVSGATKSQFGIDLDTMDTGLNWAADGIELKITSDLPETEHKASGEEGDTAYGEIGINGIELIADNGYNGLDGDYGSSNMTMTWDALWVKLVLGDLTVKLRNGPSTTVDYQGADDSWYLQNAYNYSIFSGMYGGGNSTLAVAKSYESWNTVYFNPQIYDTTATESVLEDDIEDPLDGNVENDPNYGIQLVYAIPSVMDIMFDVASHDSWSDTTTENEYAFKAGIDLKAVENLTFQAGANFSNYAETQGLAVGGKVGYTIGIGESDSIKPVVALSYINEYDLYTLDPKTFIGHAAVDALGVSGGVEASVAGIKAAAYAAMFVPDLDNSDTSLFATTVTADVGAVENLTVQLALEMVSLIDPAITDTHMGIHAKLGYAIAAGDITITPSVQGSFNDPSDQVTDDEELFMKAEIAIAGLLDNTTFYLNWDSNELMDNNNAVAGDTMGQLVFTTKVSF